MVFQAFDDSMKFYGELYEVHQKKVNLSVDLIFDQAIDLKMVPFIMLNDFYHQMQDQITKDLTGNSEQYKYKDCVFKD